jgi:hypothetical protein
MEAREIRMNHLVLMAVVIPISVLIAPSFSAFAYNDPKHCSGYDACFSVGYDDGYSDAQKGLSLAYACTNHSQGWCSGYSEGFRAGNGGSNIYNGPNTGQSARIDVHGNNNKISIDQRANSQSGDTGGFSSDHKENSRTSLPKCVILCFNSNIRIN